MKALFVTIRAILVCLAILLGYALVAGFVINLLSGGF